MEYAAIPKIIFVINFLIITSGIIVSFIAALTLYQDAPEKSDIGFNKYWNALMLDASPGDKTLLKFEGERLKIFLIYKKFNIGVLISFGASIAILILSKHA